MRLKIFFINFIIIALLFFSVDFLFFCFLQNKYSQQNFKLDLKGYIEASKIKKFDNLYKGFQAENYFRNTLVNSQKQPILILGCSFGYGWLLDEKQALSYKLAINSKRSVYNQSIPSLGLQYFPYILENFELEKQIQNPEYIIFVFIENHIYRLYRYQIEDAMDSQLDIRYKQTLIGLEEIKHKYYIFEHFAIYRYLQNKYANHIFINNSYDKNFDFMKLHFLKAKQIANEIFPNSKIVILKYEEKPDSWYYNTERWKELEDAGFIILGSYELTNKHLYEDEYRIKDDVHPNEYAWDLLVPQLVKKLDL